jgi:hypothetical protein
VLDRLRAELLADFGQRGFALVAFHAGGAHLDELVRVQRAADFRDYRLGEALFAEVEDRIQRMGARFQRLAFARFYRSPRRPLTR